VKEKHLGDDQVEASSAEVELAEIAAADLDDLTYERLEPVGLKVDSHDRSARGSSLR
jgi:hypothetical protein